MRAVLIAALGVLAAPALAGPKPKPGFEAAVPAAQPAPRVADGGIFSVSAGYAPLHDGRRARAVGDPITITLVESTTTAKSAGSKTQRGGGFGITPPTAGPLSFLNPNALKASGESSFNGQGNASGRCGTCPAGTTVCQATNSNSGVCCPTATSGAWRWLAAGEARVWADWYWRPWSRRRSG